MSRNEAARTALVAAVAGAAGIFFGSNWVHAQPATAATAATVATPVKAAAPAVPGSIQVMRLTDTTFVTVKDEGDAETVTLFSTEAGLVQRKHNARFYYESR